MNIDIVIKSFLLMAALVIQSGCAVMPNPDPVDTSMSYKDQSSHRQELQTFTDNEIRMKLLWHAPHGEGPFPTIIVHPGRGETIFELGEILTTLADNGYAAVAAGYQRRSQDGYGDTLLPWRTLEDTRRVIDAVRSNRIVDRERIGTLGFSLGGAHSLLLAAGSEEIKTAVVYYPMSDFPAWIEEKRNSNLFWRMMMAMWRSRFEADRTPDSSDSMESLLAFYSPINHTQKIDIPLLIIHGDKDRTTPLAHSIELKKQIKEAGNPHTSLMVMDNAAHAFNFRSRSYKEATAKGWDATLNWLSIHLGSKKMLNVALNRQG